MKFVKKIIGLIKDNFKIKIGICIFLMVALIIILVYGSIYSNDLNKKNLSFQVTKKKESKENNKVNKEIEEEKLKKDKLNNDKLNEIKNKIKELFEDYDISTTQGDIDKDIIYYENIYNELLKQKEEEKEEENEVENTYNENINIENNEYNQNDNIITPSNPVPDNPEGNNPITNKPNEDPVIPADNVTPNEPNNPIVDKPIIDEEVGEEDDFEEGNSDIEPVIDNENKPNEVQQ